jgi:hypothetical protein
MDWSRNDESILLALEEEAVCRGMLEEGHRRLLAAIPDCKSKWIRIDCLAFVDCFCIDRAGWPCSFDCHMVVSWSYRLQAQSALEESQASRRRLA